MSGSEDPETARCPVGRSISGGGYDPAFFDRLASIEDRHFWFVCRNELVFHFAKKAGAGLGAGSLVLEAGCGTGNILRFLANGCPRSTVVGMDLWLEGLHHAKGRTKSALVQGDVRLSPFSRPFDILGMFDVLEHIPDDEEILRGAYSMLRPGGTLLLTVPAHMSLWSYFDVAARHCRRYARAELQQKLESAGFEIAFLTQFMGCIFIPVWLGRCILGRRGQRRTNQTHSRNLAEQELRVVPVVNSILRFMLRLETGWVARGHTLPVGTSLLVVAKKPQ